MQKRIHHLALDSRSGRDKAQAYASSLSPGGSSPWRTGAPPRTPSSRGPRTPGVSKRPSFVIDVGDDQTPGVRQSTRQVPGTIQSLTLEADDTDCQNDIGSGEILTPPRPPSAKGLKRKGSRLSSQSSHPSSLQVSAVLLLETRVCGLCEATMTGTVSQAAYHK